MSTLDISRITLSLASSKIKERNDALSLLDTLSSSRFSLTAKQLKLLINAIFELIQLESSLYKANPIAATDTRLSRAALSLKLILEKSSSIQLKYKTLLGITSNIVDNFFIEQKVLEPCALDFAIIFNRILALDYFIEHLTIEEWNGICHFLTRVLSMLISQWNNSYNSLITTMFEALHNLYQCLTSVNYLHIYHNYKILYPIIEDSLQLFKSDHQIVTINLKLINKLAIVLSTQDASFVNKLLGLGVKILLNNHNTTWDSIQIQILTFLNLSATHSLMNWGLLTKEFQEEEMALVLDSQTLPPTFSETRPETNDILVYNVKTLILNLISKLNTGDYKFESSDIGIIHTTDHERTWFKLNTIYLKSGNHKSWMLALGISRLVCTYYKLKQSLSENSDESDSSRIESFETPRKRLKVDRFSSVLDKAANPSEFFIQLAKEHLSAQEQQKTLQLLVFYLESDEQNPYVDNSVLNELSRLTLWSFKDEFKFWTFHSIGSIVYYQTDMTDIHVQLLKLSLQSLKDPSAWQISCSLFYNLVLLSPNEEITTDISLVTQLDSLIELPKINGPLMLSNEAIQFWYAIYKFMIRIDFQKRALISRGIETWLIDKLERNQINENNLLLSCSGLPKFIGWLCGVEVEYNVPTALPSLYCGPMAEFCLFEKTFHKLEEFMLIKTSHQKPENSKIKDFALDHLSKQDFTGLFEVLLRSCESSLDPYLNFQWGSILIKLGSLLSVSGNMGSICARIEQNSEELFESSKGLSDESKLNILSLASRMEWDISLPINLDDYLLFNDFTSHEDSREASAAPMELISADNLGMDVLGDFFGNEFNEVKFRSRKDFPVANSKNKFKLEYSCIPSVESTKFLINFNKSRNLQFASSLSSLAIYLDQLNLPDFLSTVYFLVGYIEHSHIEPSSISPHLSSIVRLMGERILTNHELERNELTIITVSKLLTLLVSLFVNGTDDDFKRDCFDMSGWLIECGEKALIYTQESVTEYCKWLCVFMLRNDETIISNMLVQSNMLNYVRQSPNIIKISLAVSILKWLDLLLGSKRTIEYHALVSCFVNPEELRETASTYSLFFMIISRNSTSIFITSLFNQLKLSKFGQFAHYLEPTLEGYADIMNLSNTKELFTCYKLEILRFWWKFDNLSLFPWKVFGFNDQAQFLKSNYKEIVAVSMTTKEEKHSLETDSEVDNLYLKIAQSRDSSLTNIINESIPLIIALAYSKDGIRNQIFELLANQNIQYKLLLTKDLQIAILQIISHTDLSNDTLLKDLFASDLASSLFLRSYILPKNEKTSISINSSLDLIQKLVQKYGKGGKEFWNVHTVYFLIRRISLTYKSSRSIEDKIQLLRQIKLIVLLGGSHTRLEFQVVNLIIRCLCALSGDATVHEESELTLYFCQDILGILQSFDIQYFSRYAEDVLPLMIHLISVLLKAPKAVLSKSLLKNLKEYILHLESKRSIYPILITAVEILGSFPTHLPPWSIEKFLADSKEIEICTGGGNLNDILSLISNIFPSEISSTILDYSDNVVKILLKVKSTDYPKQSNNFKLWSARYLGKYYLNGGLMDGPERILEQREFENIDGNDFFNAISSFGILLRLIESYLSDENPEICACAESIMGSLIQMLKSSNSSSIHAKDFSLLLSPYLTYILPLSYQSCNQLNDEPSYQLNENVHSFISNIHEKAKEGAEMFAFRFFLSILNELSEKISLAPLMAIFASKVPGFARKQLPFLLCYYANTKNDALKLVTEAVFQMHNMEMPNEMIRLFMDILVSMRICFRKGLSAFGAIFDSLDLEICYKLASEINLYHTALMIFEDKMNGSNINCVNMKTENPNSIILRKIYQSLDDEDLVYGLPVETSLDYAFKLVETTSSDLFNFDSGYLDAHITLDDKNTPSGPVLKSMLANGYLGVSKMLNQEGSNNYEWAWKLNCWDLPAVQKPDNENAILYKALKLILERSAPGTNICENMLVEVLSNKDRFVDSFLDIKTIGNQSLSWMKLIATLESVRDIIDYFNDFDFVKPIENFNDQTKWFERCDIDFSENILNARQVAFQILAGQSGKQSRWHWLAIINELSRFNNIARNNRKQQKMISSTILLDRIAKNKISSADAITKQISNLSKYHNACSLWSQGQTSIPVLMLQEIQEDGGISLPVNQLSVSISVVNSRLVEWMSESRQDLASNIMEKYVIPTYRWMSEETLALESQQPHRNDPKVYEALAHFCETQYKSRGLNEDILKLEKRVANKKQEIEELKSHYSKTSVSAKEKKNVQKFYVKLKHQLQLETNELENIKSNKEKFSFKAVELYLKSVSFGGSEECLDKFFSLWLENTNRDVLNASIKNFLLKLPSYKLISWCAQLISRLSNEQTSFQNLLHLLLVQLCVDHPHHTLYQLMSLRKHEAYSSDITSGIIISKYMAANKLWNELSHENPLYQEILSTIELFCNESVKLAEYKVPKGKSLNLDRASFGKYWLESLPHIPPPTKNLPLDQTTMYKNIPKLHRIDCKISIATSGLSLPKIATFTLTDGSTHKILFKHGTDDLRQDSIMEQVFEKVNHIFHRARETRRRKLAIRTYKAVPIGPQSGIIEFVANSIALVDIVKPYHIKYDLLQLDKARIKMKDCQSNDKEERIRVYKEVTSGIHPVLRYFFFENFVTPDSWFKSRISYSHGMATTSMVGHMLGLGDRHCNNILIDKSTGEPIHIDLGVAFDQGKRLPIPETVPFRLTRDLVDGLGVTGVEGVFKRSCELTFKVLRANKDHIISILDVLRWDPLYSWALSPIRKKKLQDDDTGWVVQPEEDGSEAGRAVLTVMDKLTAGGLSDEAVVRELIQEATSESNLALIYFGWCPFF
ncbi:uncharacterized protein CANTADRAFT_45339 [Suhomyces tanzawaensis NRRL Y-17324]|uniref:Serine/threonine-protein kinase Tel1 n=1 Tax=Suhomyces tanzawaensis NRRL Y-17324 TaxID=984487 RepID=A0A1E4SQX2_9ASCO|nr:uncharacterized protein CANTADRAFT_45339 [Suhomyces tanzawaensis NRRL Y-17324]ODV81910.1 hypothetical protein CANTADRAFT_45339 [Suhomyces tanzawaensis NRRL Y-17324]